MRVRLFVLALLVTAVLAGPTRNRESCVKECSNDQKFLYQTGEKYEYHYEAETIVGIEGTFDDASSLKVTATAFIQPVSPCEFVLSLSNVALEGSSKSEEFSAAVERRPITFNFDNGVVKNICGAVEEEPWVSNFKKGLLSTLQNSMNQLEGKETLTETDISGICETHYKTRKEGTQIFVEKHKQPSTCTRRPQSFSKLSSFGYNTDTLLRGFSPISSEQACKQEISGDLVRMSKCDEVHLFKPFSKENKGAYTKTSTSLVYRRSQVGTPIFLTDSMEKHDLIFVDTEIDSEKTITKNILDRLEKVSETGVTKEVPVLFSELVLSLKSLTFSEINILFAEYQDSTVRKFLVDAMPLVGTSESMAGVGELIKKGSFSEREQDMWFTGLAFIEDPTLNMFDALLPIVEKIKNKKNFLGISSLIHNYCKKNLDCSVKSEITNIINVMETSISGGCHTSDKEQKEQILFVLKALGNSGVLLNGGQSLEQCYMNENDMEIRVSAIQAFRRVSCDDYSGNNLMDVFQDESQDSELRIAAYLGLMSCPSRELINVLRERLSIEEVNQVGSFIWTHLSNLQETAAKDKQSLRQLVGIESLQKKFSTNALKFSRNFESSFYLEEQKIGGSAEANVIFSSNSFLPRSAMLNLTVDVFGQAVNLFEVGGRIHGFEKYIEKFFGPEGYYPDETMAEIIQTFKDGNQQVDSDPEGSYYLKLFGNDLFYNRFQNVDDFLPKFNVENIMENIFKFTSNKGLEFSKSYNFVDSEFNFPTITGFPVNLKLNGSATIDFKLDGDFNFNGMKSFDINGKLRPSAAIRLDSAMAVDAFVTKSGMKMVSTMFTSTHFDGKLKVEGGKLVDFALKIPEDKYEIYDFSNEFFKIENNKIIPETGDVERSSNCYTPIFKILGLEICYQKFYSPSDEARPYFPLNGPYGRRLFVQKTKEFEGYELRFSRDSYGFELFADILGTKSNRWHLKFDRHSGNGYEVKVETPYSQYSGEAKVKRDKDGISAALKLNDYQGMFELSGYSGLGTIKHRCVLHLSNASEDLISYSSQFSRNDGDKTISGDLTLSGKNVPKTNINFAIDQRPDHKAIEFHVSSTPVQASLSGFLRVNTDYIALKLDGSYSYSDLPAKTLHASARYLRKEEGGFKVYAVSGEVREFGVDFDWQTKLGETSIENKGRVKYSGGSMSVEQLTGYKSLSEGGKEYHLLIKFNAPSLGMKISIKNIVVQKGFYQSKGLIEYNDNLKHSHEITWSMGEEITLNFDFNFNDISHVLKINLIAVEPGFYKIQATRQMNSKTEKLEGSFQNHSNRNKFDIKIDGNLELFGKNYRLESGAVATKSEFNLKGKVQNQNQLHYVTIKASPTIVEFDTNVYRTVSAVAKMNLDSEKQFEFEAKYENQEPVKAVLLYSQSEFEATFKMEKINLGISIKLEENGCQFKAQWNPSDIINFRLSFSPRPRYSVSAELDTPFLGFEKQDLKLNFNRNTNGFDGQFSSNWRNIHHLSVTWNTSLEKGFETKFDVNFRVSSTIVSFELIEFSTQYSKKGASVVAKVDGKWNDKIASGRLTAMPTDTGYHSQINFESPCTGTFKQQFDFAMSTDYLSTSYLLNYGSQTARMDLKLDQSDQTNKIGSFVLKGIYLPDVNLNGFIKTSENNMISELEGTINNKKVMLASKCETELVNGVKICKMSFKFMLPSGKVFNLQSTLTLKENRQFNVDIKITPLFFADQDIKINMDGGFVSIQNSFFDFNLSGPFNAELKFAHNIEGNDISTAFFSTVDKFTFGFDVSGVLIDTQKVLGNFEFKTKSSCPKFDGISVHVKRDVKGEARNTLVNIRKGEFVAKIYNSMTFQDAWNWHNNIIFNDIYSFKSSIEKNGNVTKHKMQYTWRENIVESYVEVKKTDRFEITVTFASPWTSLLKFEVARKRVEDNIVGTLKFAYGHNKDFEATADYNIMVGSSFDYKFDMNCKNGIWTPMTMEFDSDFGNSPRKVNIKTVFNDLLTLEGKFSYDQSQYNADIFVDGKFLSKPARISGAYSNLYTSKFNFNVDVNDVTYRMKLENKKGDIYFSHLYVPFITYEAVHGQCEFDFNSTPFKISLLTSSENENRYKFSAIYDKGIFDFTFDSFIEREDTVKFKVSWKKEPSDGFVKINVSSLHKYFSDIFLDVAYDFSTEKTFSWKGKLSQYKTNAEFIQNFGHLLYDFTISISGKGIEAELKNKGKLLEGKISNDHGDKGYFIFTREYNRDTGTFDLSGNQIRGGKKTESNASLNYSLVGDKSVNFKASIRDRKLSFYSKVKDVMPFKFEMTMEDSSKVFKKATLNAVVAQRSVNIEGTCGERNFNVDLKSSFDSSTGGEILLDITSNVPNWSKFSNKFKFQIENRPYYVLMVTDSDQGTRKYSLNLDFDSKSFNLDVMTPMPDYRNVKVDGSYQFDDLRLETSFGIDKNGEITNINGNFDFNSIVPTVKVTIATPYDLFKTINMDIAGEFSSTQKKFKIECKVNDIPYRVNIFTALDKSYGEAKFQLNLPMLQSEYFKLTKFDFKYDLASAMKVVELNMQRGTENYNYLAKVKFENNEFHLDLVTPFEQAKNIHATGTYRLGDKGYYTAAKFFKNGIPYFFEGNFAVTERSFSLEGTTSFENYMKFRVDGVVDKNKLVFTFRKEGDILIKKTITVEYQLEDGKAQFEVKTPFSVLSYFAIGGEAKLSGRQLEARAFIYKNSEKLEMRTSFFTSYEKSFIGFLVELPEQNEKYGFKIYYDIRSDERKAGVVVNIADWTKKLTAELYIPSGEFNEAYVKIVSTYPGFEKIGLDYKYFINHDTKEANIVLTSYKNDEIVGFAFENLFRFNHFLVKLKTPFENYKNNILEAHFDLQKKVAKFIIIGGPYNLVFDTYCNENDAAIIFESPWTKSLNINAKKGIKNVFFNMIYGEHGKVELNVSFDPYNSSIETKLISPFTKNTYDFQAFYNFLNPLKEIHTELNINSICYKLSTAVERGDNMAEFRFNLVSPWYKWTNVQFIVGYNFEDNDKALIFTFGRNDEEKLIDIRGTIVDDEVKFMLEVPFESMGKVKTLGSLNRAKRSIELRAMNEQHDAGIVANFNSFKMNVKTPYDQAKQANLEIIKSKKGGWKLDYKRNDRFLSIDITPQGKKKGVAVKVDSKLPGWLPLLFHGLLNEGEFKEYVTYKKTIGDITYSGSGNFGSDKGDYHYKVQTPFPRYQEVTGLLEYNNRKRTRKLSVTSSSSDFRINYTFKRGSPSIDIYIPFEEHEATVIKGSFTPMKSDFKISSRFPIAKSISLSHSIELGHPKIVLKALYERNSVKRFDLLFKADQQKQTAHLMINYNIFGNKAMLHVHRVGMESYMFEFTRNEKSFKLDSKGSGPGLLLNGRIDFTVENSFRETPVTVTGNIQFKRDQTPKKIIMELVYPGSRLYAVYLTYNIDLNNLKKGDFKINTVTPTREMAPWKNISGDWKYENGVVTINYSRGGVKNIKLTANIKFNDMKQGKVQWESNIFFPKNTYGLTWKLVKRGSARNYYIKAERGDYFIEQTFKGKAKGQNEVSVSGSFQASRFMKKPLKYSLSWKKTDNEITGEGTFEIGKKSGTHKLLYYRRNPSERSAQFKWEAKTNLKNFNKISLDGQYSLVGKSVDISLSWDTDKIFIKGAIADFSKTSSSNALTFHSPFTGDGELNFSHDFTNPLAKKILITGFIGGKEVKYDIHWTRTANFRVFDLNAEITSAIIGSNIKMHYNYDVSNWKDSKAHFTYNRNDVHKVEWKYALTVSEKNISEESLLTTTFKFLPRVHTFFHADWSKGIHVDMGVESPKGLMKAELKIEKGKATLSVVTPMHDDINAELVYNVTGKTRTVTMDYSRGNRIVKFDAQLETPNKKKGTIKLHLTTPFELVRTLSIDGNWKKGNFQATYNRNDVSVEVNGKAEIDVKKSSFDLRFNLPNGKPVQFGFGYDLDNFIDGKGRTPSTLMSLDLSVAGKTVMINTKGLRSTGGFSVELNGATSFDRLKLFKINWEMKKIGNEGGEGRFEIKVNDFSYLQNDKMEWRKDGFYFRTNVESSLTKLPGLVFGIGREGEACILTLGVGTEDAVREVTITVKGKNGYKKGFSGKIDIPRLNIFNVNYDVNYSFKGENQLAVDIKIPVKKGNIEFDLLYDSTGVKSRILSPIHGLHSLRLRRSISDDHFMTDIGIDDFGFTIGGKRTNVGFSKGFNLEGQIFGKEVHFNTLFRTTGTWDTEGRLFLEVPFLGLNNYGCSLKTSNNEKLYTGDFKCKLYYEIIGVLDFETDDDMNLKKGKASLSVAEDLYKLEGTFDRTGNSYDLMVTLDTPYTPINLEGSFAKITSGLSYSGNLELNFGDKMYSTNFEFDKTDTGIRGEFDITCPNGVFTPKVKFVFTKEGNIKTINLEVNERRFVVVYSYDISPLNLNFDSTVYRSGVSTHSFGFEMDHSSKIIGFYFKYSQKEEHIFKFDGKYGTLKTFKIRVNSKFVPFSNMDVAYRTDEDEVFKFDLITRRGEYSAILQKKLDNTIKSASFQIHVKLPEHTKYQIDFAFLNEEKKELDIVVKSGEVYVGSFNIALSTVNGMYSAIKLERGNYPHTLYFDYNRNTKSIVISGVSEYLPTGALKGEGYLSVISAKNFDTMASFSTSVDTYRTEVTMDFEMPNQKEFKFELYTPVENYKHINMGLHFEKKEITIVSVFMEPFNFKANVFYGIENSILKTGLNAQTGIEHWKNMGFDAYVPLNAFAPKFSVILGERTYGIETTFDKTREEGIFSGKLYRFNTTNYDTKSVEFGINYTTIAPYKLAYNYNYDLLGYNLDRKFGIIVDSSFFSIFSPRSTFLS